MRLPVVVVENKAGLVATPVPDIVSVVNVPVEAKVRFLLAPNVVVLLIVNVPASVPGVEFPIVTLPLVCADPTVRLPVVVVS